MQFQFGPDPNHFIEVDRMTPPGVLPRVGVICPKYEREEEERIFQEKQTAQIQAICRRAKFVDELLESYFAGK